MHLLLQTLLYMLHKSRNPALVEEVEELLLIQSRQFLLNEDNRRACALQPRLLEVEECILLPLPAMLHSESLALLVHQGANDLHYVAVEKTLAPPTADEELPGAVFGAVKAQKSLIDDEMAAFGLLLGISIRREISFAAMETF
jgi:hypothetical protein